jgi:hypothetical protein
MRTLLIGVLAATLVGCSYPLSPQVSMDASADPNGSGCGSRIAATRSKEAAPAPSKASAATPKAKSAIATKTEERPAATDRNRPQLAENNAKPPVIEAKLEAPSSARPGETPDPVIVKAKTTIAAKLEDPASAEFGEMKRAMRKNTFGKSVDTICGRIKRKKASGEDAADWPFLYLVTEDEAYVVNGAANSAAASAYRNICS